MTCDLSVSNLSSKSLDGHSASSPPLLSEAKSSQTSVHPPPAAASQPKILKLSKPRFNRDSLWVRAWRPPNVIIGLYVLSIVLAAAHCAFFQYLDTRVVSPGVELSRDTTMVPQGYVTTISFLLVTAFRATLVASIGICYTQYLWATLRTHVLKAGLIEDLFQIQTNAFHLTSASIYSRTPVLATIAMFCWLVPIATVYPPGALIVQLESLPFESLLNVPVFHAKNYMYDTHPVALSKIRCNFSLGTHGPLKDYPKALQNASFLRNCESRWGESDDVQLVARTSLMSGEMANLARPSGENSSYSLQFWGTTLECQSLNQTIEINLREDDFRYNGPDVWVVQNFSRSCGLWSNDGYDSTLEDPSITHRVANWPNVFRYYPCIENSKATSVSNLTSEPIGIPDTGIRVLMPVTDTVCRPKPTRYSINVTFAGGEQHISYSLDNKAPIPAYSAKFQNYNGSYEQWVHLSDAMSIYFDFAANLNRSFVADYSERFDSGNATERSSSHSTSNRTTVETCLLNSVRDGWSPQGRPGLSQNDLEIWPLSVFERRYRRRGPNGERVIHTCPIFKTELAKELLINTTISALSLNKQFDSISGTVFRSFNVYRFQDKLAFFLPYGLAVALAIPIVALGLSAFYVRNQGTSAITGGFLQLLMTTTGRTSLESLITGPATIGGNENVTDELRAAEIAFGELFTASNDPPKQSVAANRHSVSPMEDSGTTDATLLVSNVDVDVETLESSRRLENRMGFGLVQEIRQLRRRHV